MMSIRFEAQTITSAAGCCSFDFDAGRAMPEYSGSPCYLFVLSAVEQAQKIAYRKQVAEMDGAI